jgi:hypothetical protein
MIRVPLTQGQFALIDDEDGPAILAHKWCAIWNKDTRSFYAARGVYVDGRVRPIKLHRFLLGLTWGDKREVDHVHHDTLDNRRSEIRIATRAENMQNKRVYRNSPTGFTGITYRKQKFQARLQRGKVSRHLGYFQTLPEAVAAYNAAKQELVYGSH